MSTPNLSKTEQVEIDSKFYTLMFTIALKLFFFLIVIKVIMSKFYVLSTFWKSGAYSFTGCRLENNRRT